MTTDENRQHKSPESSRASRKESTRSIMSDTRYGRWFSIGFFKKNAWMLLLILVAVLSLIGLRYKTKTKMVQIKQLRTELERAESDMLREKAEYMSLIRETEMRRLVNEKGLGLTFQEQPPYEIIDDK